MSTPSHSISDSGPDQPRPALVDINGFLESSLRALVPVTEADQPTLIETLRRASRESLNHKEALESLHGVNEHVASQWKDYYLEHKIEIDEAVHHSEPTRSPTPVAPDTPDRPLIRRPLPRSRSSAKKPFTYLPPSSSSEAPSDSESESDGTPCPPPRKAAPSTSRTSKRTSKFASPSSKHPWIDQHLKSTYAEFTDSDMDKMVGYIVYQKNWEEQHKDRRWTALSQEARPYRTPSAWQHHYIKRKATIDRKVREAKHKVEAEKRSRGDYRLQNQNHSQAMFLREGSAYETGSTTSEATDDSSSSTASS